jgi:hypothetical protein
MSFPKIPGLLLMLGAACFVVIAARTAEARPLYSTQWLKMYPAAVKRNNVSGAAKCDVCHGGESKRERNIYGQAVARALGGQRNVKNPKTIDQALLKAGGDESAIPGTTFGKLLQAGDLPTRRE